MEITFICDHCGQCVPMANIVRGCARCPGFVLCGKTCADQAAADHGRIHELDSHADGQSQHRSSFMLPSTNTLEPAPYFGVSSQTRPIDPHPITATVIAELDVGSIEPQVIAQLHKFRCPLIEYVRPADPSYLEKLTRSIDTIRPASLAVMSGLLGYNQQQQQQQDTQVVWIHGNRMINIDAVARVGNNDATYVSYLTNNVLVGKLPDCHAEHFVEWFARLLTNNKINVIIDTDIVGQRNTLPHIHLAPNSRFTVTTSHVDRPGCDQITLTDNKTNTRTMVMYITVRDLDVGDVDSSAAINHVLDLPCITRSTVLVANSSGFGTTALYAASMVINHLVIPYGQSLSMSAPSISAMTRAISVNPILLAMAINEKCPGLIQGTQLFHRFVMVIYARLRSKFMSVVPSIF